METVEGDPIVLLIRAVELKKISILFKYFNDDYEEMACSWVLDSRLYQEDVES